MSVESSVRISLDVNRLQRPLASPQGQIWSALKVEHNMICGHITNVSLFQFVIDEVPISQSFSYYSQFPNY